MLNDEGKLLQEELVFQRLAATVEEAGLLETRLGPYAWIALLLASLFCAAGYCASQVELVCAKKPKVHAAGCETAEDLVSWHCLLGRAVCKIHK